MYREDARYRWIERRYAIASEPDALHRYPGAGTDQAQGVRARNDLGARV